MNDGTTKSTSDELTAVPPGWYLRQLIAGSTGIGGRPIALGDILLGDDEVLIADMLVHHRSRKLAGLSVEQSVQWGALYLFLVARSAHTPLTGPLFDEPMTTQELAWIRKGVSFLESRGVGGAQRAYDTLCASLAAAGRTPADERDTHEELAPPVWRVEAEPMPEILNRNRLRARVIPSDGTVERDTEAVRLTLRVQGRDDIRTEIDDAPGAVFLKNQVEIATGPQWTEILFRLEGSFEEDTPVEVALSDAVDGTPPFLVEYGFAVTAGSSGSSICADDGARGPVWGVGRLIEHLKIKGSVTEAEVRRLLGLPSSFRRFLLEIEGNEDAAPLRVQIEMKPKKRQKAE